MCPKCGSEEIRLQLSFRFTRLKGAEQSVYADTGGLMSSFPKQ
jgi:hypothetical protein